jgi:hypothetical protein
MTVDQNSGLLQVGFGEAVAMSEVIRIGSFERLDRSHYDVADEIQIMAEAGDRHDRPAALSVLSTGALYRFFLRLGVTAPVH